MYTFFCPVHLHARKLCDEECLDARRVLQRLGADYRQYWSDRRRGVQPQRPLRVRRDPRPLWQAWGIAA